MWPTADIHRQGHAPAGKDKMISVFDIFKIGIGPSSSHTVGPMKAAKLFIDQLRASRKLLQTTHILVDVYGSLSWTGKGHHTDRAILLGLAGNLPEKVDLDKIDDFLQRVETQQQLPLGEEAHPVSFPSSAMVFHDEALPLHENGMTLSAFKEDELLLKETYYSVGGGLIVDEAHFASEQKSSGAGPHVPYPFNSAEQLLSLCQEHGLSIASLIMENEKITHCEPEIHKKLAAIWQVMEQGVERGCHTEGVLPGPLKVTRRAAALHRKLTSGLGMSNDPMSVIDWVNMFSLAVSEENAAGGRVVTAPTNGAAGIIPGVLSYYNKFVHPLTEQDISRFYLTSGP